MRVNVPAVAMSSEDVGEVMFPFRSHDHVFEMGTGAPCIEIDGWMYIDDWWTMRRPGPDTTFSSRRIPR